MRNRSPNQHLIGKPAGRNFLNTPALIIDLDALHHNINVMAEFARVNNLTLRPHAKTHRSHHIARLQLDAGAVGLCCAKLAEAEALASEGLGPFLITSPVVGPGALSRLANLCGQTEVAVVVDNIDNIAALGALLLARTLTVFIDLDPGHHRTGVTDAATAVQLARTIASHKNLHFGGLQFFSGPTQHIEKYSSRAADMMQRTTHLTSVVTALCNAGMPPPIVTGSGTGTFEIDARLGVFTELQVGSYVFLDDQYLDCELSAEHRMPFRLSLTADTRVISANTSGMATVDGGLKAFTGSPHPPRIVDGAPPDSFYEYRGDEHGVIVLPKGATSLKIGDMVTLSTPHCDPTVNLYDFYHVVKNGVIVDIWPITARGCSY